MLEEWDSRTNKLRDVIAYADDLAIVNLSQEAWEDLKRTTNEWGLKISTNKTKQFGNAIEGIDSV